MKGSQEEDELSGVGSQAGGNQGKEVFQGEGVTAVPKAPGSLRCGLSISIGFGNVVVFCTFNPPKNSIT